MGPVIQTENVQVQFRRGLLGEKIHALDGLSLEVMEGDFFALVGQNGAGKSTAMYCLLGLLAPTAGRVLVMGKKPELGARLYQSIAYLPEEPQYDLYLTVEEAVRYYTALYGKRCSEQAIQGALERLDLGSFRRLPLSKCSKGMKQKVGLAQCLILETRLLFLDEPTRGLDPLIVRSLREVLLEINRRGATIVMNSHVLSEVEMMANRVAIIEKGKVIAQEDIHTLLAPDQKLYEVAVVTAEGMPDYFQAGRRQGDMQRGVIPAERLYDFMEFTRTHSLKVMECSLKVTTLEDTLVSILRNDAAGQENEKAAN